MLLLRLTLLAVPALVFSTTSTPPQTSDERHVIILENIYPYVKINVFRFRKEVFRIQEDPESETINRWIAVGVAEQPEISELARPRVHRVYRRYLNSLTDKVVNLLRWAAFRIGNSTLLPKIPVLFFVKKIKLLPIPIERLYADSVQSIQRGISRTSFDANRTSNSSWPRGSSIDQQKISVFEMESIIALRRLMGNRKVLVLNMGGKSIQFAYKLSESGTLYSGTKSDFDTVSIYGKFLNVDKPCPLGGCPSRRKFSSVCLNPRYRALILLRGKEVRITGSRRNITHPPYQCLQKAYAIVRGQNRSAVSPMEIARKRLEGDNRPTLVFAFGGFFDLVDKLKRTLPIQSAGINGAEWRCKGYRVPLIFLMGKPLQCFNHPNINDAVKQFNCIRDAYLITLLTYGFGVKYLDELYFCQTQPFPVRALSSNSSSRMAVTWQLGAAQRFVNEFPK